MHVPCFLLSSENLYEFWPSRFWFIQWQRDGAVGIAGHSASIGSLFLFFPFFFISQKCVLCVFVGLKKKILFAIFKSWKSYIWKIRLTDNKSKIWRNFNSFFCLLAFMLNFKILFWHKYETNEQNYRKWRQLLIWYFVDLLIALITYKFG